MIQLKGYLTMPFMNAHYIREVLFIFPNEPFFEQKYLRAINSWIEHNLSVESIKTKEVMIN
jgi:hypothetical protein